MHKNRFWLFFLVFISLSVLWFTAKSIPKFYSYYVLTETTQPEKVEWFIHQKGSDRYFLAANFTFLVKGEERSGNTKFNKPILRNQTAADKFKGIFEEKNWTVWYAPKNNKQSTLEKVFPFKDLTYLLILWGVLIYYIRIGINVGKKSHY